MAEILTAQQQMAVSNRGGKLLVSAAAGSGKTKVLVDRLMSYLLDPDDPANLDDFLIITFTKAAATELRGKIASKLSEKIALMPENKHLRQQMQRLYLAKISTVHSFCADILREYAYRLDISADFRIAEDKECLEMQLSALESVLDRAYEDSDQDADFRVFVDTQGLGRDDYLIPQIILNTYGSAMCHLDPYGWLDWCVNAFDISDLEDAGQTVWGQYLICDLHDYLDLQIKALTKCVKRLAECDGMNKPLALLSSTIEQLSRLREQNTWDGILAHKNIDYGRLTFPKNCTDVELTEKVKHVRNVCKKGLEAKLQCFSDSSKRVLNDLEQSGSAARGMVKLVKAFSNAYDKCKRARRVMDYSDLEHKMLDLVLGKKRSYPTAIAAEIGARFREIMVDEYQDTNQVQDAIFGALTHLRNNCFMVGDVKQSIYQFRLADPGIFIEKYNTYAPAEKVSDNSGRKVLLSSNFRSSGGVISAVNHVFSHCMTPKVGGLYYGEEEMLQEGIPHIDLPEPEVELHAINVQEDTYSEEAAFVADKICMLLDGTHMIRQGDTLRPITPDDIVILLRSPGSVGAHFVYALEQRGIRCVTGKGIDLLQTEEISTLRSLLQIISNPLQDIPLTGVVMSPLFGFSADELAQMRSQNRFASIYSLLTASDSKKAVEFIKTLSDLRYEARQLTLSQLIQRIFSVTGFDNIYSAMPDGQARSENLRAFCQLASDFERSTRRDLNQFLSYLDMMEADGLRIGGEEKQAGAVTIMSIHTSKGLEFPVVFLAGLSRRFNQESARERVLCDKDLGLGLCCADTDMRVRYSSIARRAISRKIVADSISEEMRILYVAMTRARDRLIMTYASNKLESELQSVAFGLDMYDAELLNGYVSCAGAWVMHSAMRRTDAGALFALGGHPDCACFCEPTWLIQVHDGSSADGHATAETTVEGTMRPEILHDLQTSLSFIYPYADATAAPSKLTATQLKGREKDLEAAEHAEEKKILHRHFRKASFVSGTVDAQTYGNAVHAIMQYIRFELCVTETAVHDEIRRLVRENLITQEQADLVDPRIISDLFATPLGTQLRTAEKLLREFKFSVLDDAMRYVPGLKNEQVLLQGVVDCAMLEPDGITVIDFKTDRVSEETLQLTADSYSAQVNTYVNALEKVFCLPVKSAWLYFFHTGSFLKVERR